MKEDPYELLRIRMVASQIEARGVTDVDVLAAMRSVPRHWFVPEEIIEFAYFDSALTLSHGQTISQPYIVGLMTELAMPGRNKRALEIGTGSGYQTAILAELCESVTTIEVIADLATMAKEKLKKLGYTNIHSIVGDGYLGHPDGGPYDLIVVTACAPDLPEALIAQLAPNGRLVIPIGQITQYLVVVSKDVDDNISIERNIAVQFVPMVHVYKRS